METEAKIKNRVRAFLKEKGFSSTTHVIKDGVGFYHMPVPYGYGSSLLDFTLCYRGHFAVLETKATGKKPTPRQSLVMELTNKAGGWAIWGDTSDACIRYLQLWIDTVDKGYGFLARQSE